MWISFVDHGELDSREQPAPRDRLRDTTPKERIVMKCAVVGALPRTPASSRELAGEYIQSV